MEELVPDRGRNVYLLKPENVTRRDGEVFTGNLMEMAQLRRSEQFKNVLFSDNMSSVDVRVRLEEAFPDLLNARFSCAKRENRDSAQLNFDGDRRVWDGITIKRKLPGSSAMYIVLEDDEEPMTRSIYLPYKPIQAVRVNPFQRRFIEPFPAEASLVDSEKNQSERSNDSSIVLHQTAHVQDNTVTGQIQS